MLSYLNLRLTRLSPRRAALLFALIACALTATSVGVGKATDDYYWSAVFRGVPGLPEVTNGILDTFSFGKGEPDEHSRYLARGIIPWWADAQWRIAFWRPLSSLSHYVDYRLWPDHTWLMHVHSMLLYAALAYATTRLYQRHLNPRWMAALAGLLFAVDSAHGLSVAWLSNRNAILSALFGVLVLLHHDRWRRDSSPLHGVLACASLLIGLLCGEGTVAIGGYLFAHACFIDKGAWSKRIAVLLPYLAVVVVWRAVYSSLGYGVTGTILYTDPLSDPSGFIQNAVLFFPILLYSHFACPDPIYTMLFPGSWFAVYVAVMLLVLAVLAWAFLPVLRQNPAARFYGAGMLLAAIPYCTSVPQYRLLTIVGIGGMGLLGAFLGFTYESAAADATPPTGARRRRMVAQILVFLHLIVSPMMLPVHSYSMKYVGDIVERGNDSIPSDTGITKDRVVILNATGDIVYAMIPLMRSALGQPFPQAFWVLYSGNRELFVSRPDAQTLEITNPLGWMEQPWSFLFCRLPHSAMRAGQVIQTEGLTVTVLSVTPDGRPDHVRFQFSRPLEDASFRWLTWRDGAYRPFTLPPVGGSVVIPELTIQSALEQLVASQVRPIRDLFKRPSKD
ncbi:MAG: hypothetical protein IT365_02755 [Candidatus Hydrogenedentes bacterium]|nr:hypothetical protein [Candidatus Hydrogenedentota bacterium]